MFWKEKTAGLFLGILSTEWAIFATSLRSWWLFSPNFLRELAFVISVTDSIRGRRIDEESRSSKFCLRNSAPLKRRTGLAMCS